MGDRIPPIVARYPTVEEATARAHAEEVKALKAQIHMLEAQYAERKVVVEKE